MARCLALPEGQQPPGKHCKFLIAEFEQNQSFCRLKCLFQVHLCDKEMSDQSPPGLLPAQLRAVHVPATLVWETPEDVFAVPQLWFCFVSLPAHKFQL